MKALLIPALVATFLTSCAHYPSARLPGGANLPEVDIPYSRFVLPNGLRLIVHEDHKAPIVAVNVWYHVGSKNEQAGRTGFAHLFEHLMFNGSENFNDEFFRPLEAAGATDMNGTTNADRTNYFANVPTPALDLLLWLESDRMGHLLGAVDQARLDEQRGVVKNEKRQGENRPYGKVWNLLPGYSYPADHPYSWTTIGSMADLDGATLEDVHEWFRTYYGAANAVIVIAGDIKPEEARAKVEHFFGDIPAGPSLQRPKVWPAPIPDERRIELEDRVPQARVHVIWNVAPNFSRDLVMLQLATEILGQGKNSRLYKRLVYDEQVATDVGAYVLPRELGSQFLVWASAKAATDVIDLEAALLEELARLKETGPGAAELERARTGIYTGFLRGLERVGGFGGKSDILASSEIYGGSPNAFARELEWLRQAQPHEVRDAMRAWLRDGRLSLTVKPLASTTANASGADRGQLPEVGAGPELRLPSLQRITLDNGLRLVLAEQHAAPVVQFQLISDAGYAADPAQLPGLASLTMAMLDEGAAGRSALSLSARLDELGAQLGTHAALDTSTVSLSAISTLVEPALDIFADVILRPDFPEFELARLKPLAANSIRQEKADPFRIGLRIVPPLLYGADHPYGVPLTGSGTEASVAVISRADISAYHQRWLRPDNSTLLVVGDIDMAQLQPLIEARFGDWQASDERPQKNLPQVGPVSGPRVFLVDRPDAEQSVVIAGQLSAPLDHPEYVGMTAANSLFGGMFTSRLNLNLREDKHWTYGARSTVIRTRAQQPFLVYARVERDRTADSMTEILREMDKLRGGQAPSGAELDGVRKNLTLTLPGRNETTSQVASSLEFLLSHELPEDHFANFVQQVNGLTGQSLVNSARTLMQPEQLTWVIIGDLRRIEAGIRRLALGSITVLDAGDLD